MGSRNLLCIIHFYGRPCTRLSLPQVDYISGGDMIGGQTSPLLQAFPELPTNVAALLGKMMNQMEKINPLRSRQDSNLRSQRESDF